MKPIQLLYVKNIISRTRGIPQQELAFRILVENLGYKKYVDVVWAGEDGIWRTLNSEYQRPAGEYLEIWCAQARLQLSSEASLPGNIQFALRYRVSGKEYWDNNHGGNYSIDADSGVSVKQGTPLLNIDYSQTLPHDQRFHAVSVAVQRSLHPKRVYIHWTTNHWRSSHTTPCFFKRTYWNRTLHSNARNPNRYGWEIWKGKIPINDAYRVEYAIGCETKAETLWDNNFGQNYTARHEHLKILTLNLHCYQEKEQEKKFSIIAKAIRDLHVDIVCLQEACEPWNDGKGDQSLNAARVINAQLRKPYYLYTDWSHIGFDTYREGVAILSRYRFLLKDAAYVSASQDIHNIHSRKVIMVQVRVPGIGLVNLFSTHLSWWSDGFREQFETLRAWAAQRHADNVAATFLCGDFNVKAGSQGYVAVVNSKDYEDQFLKATSPKVFHKVFTGSSRYWKRALKDDHRIDYIFLKKGSDLQAISAKEIFTERDYGRVSDHPGYYMEFEPVLR